MSVPVCDQVLIGGEWVRAAGGTYAVIGPRSKAARAARGAP